MITIRATGRVAPYGIGEIVDVTDDPARIKELLNQGHVAKENSLIPQDLLNKLTGAGLVVFRIHTRLGDTFQISR